MYEINVEKECGCFKRSEFENNMKFASKDEALLQGNMMVDHMNTKFCQKHDFALSENGENFSIAVGMKAKDAEAGGCCGGGHCS